MSQPKTSIESCKYLTVTISLNKKRSFSTITKTSAYTTSISYRSSASITCPTITTTTIFVTHSKSYYYCYYSSPPTTIYYYYYHHHEYNRHRQIAWQSLKLGLLKLPITLSNQYILRQIILNTYYVLSSTDKMIPILKGIDLGICY